MSCWFLITCRARQKECPTPHEAPFWKQASPSKPPPPCPVPQPHTHPTAHLPRPARAAAAATAPALAPVLAPQPPRSDAPANPRTPVHGQAHSR